jgi:RNA polymerase sigma-70 factor (ECF subfamily)
MGSNVLTVMSPSLPTPDRTLVSRARDGEVAAREQLAHDAGRSAYVFALQMTGQPEVAKDIAQESLVRFFRSLDRFDADQPVDPWLFSIVRNQVRDNARRERVRRHDSLDAWLAEGGQKAAGPEGDPALMAERRELQQRVWRAISQLGDAHREIIVLRDYNDLPYREIAKVLAIPQGTVMSRLHAARKRLREILRTEHE